MNTSIAPQVASNDRAWDNDETVLRLRAQCGHDSRSVEGCLNCEAADRIVALGRAQTHQTPVAASVALALLEMAEILDMRGPKQAKDDRADILWDIMTASADELRRHASTLATTHPKNSR